MQHFRAFFRLARVITEAGGKPVQCAPMRTSFIPSCVHIDERILKQQFKLKADKSLEGHEKTLALWAQLLDVDAPLFGKQGNKTFRGAIQTDRVALTVIKKTEAAFQSRKGPRPGKPRPPPKPKLTKKALQQKRKQPTDDNDEFLRIDQLPQATLQATKHKTVLMDPGYEDEYYMMHEDSSPKKPWVLRYTRKQKEKERRTRRAAKTREKAKDEYTEADVRYAELLMSRVSYRSHNPDDLLRYFRVRALVWPVLHGFYTTCQTSHPGSNHQAHRIREELKEGTREETDVPARSAKTYLPLSARTGEVREPQTYPLHRKLRLAAYLKKQQSDARFVRTFKKTFGKDAIPVIGNWQPFITTHGLLKCNNDNCTVTVLVNGVLESKPRLWNRDLAAACNFRHSLRSLRTSGSSSGGGGGGSSNSVNQRGSNSRDPQQGDGDSWSGSCYTPSGGSSSGRGIDQRDSDSDSRVPRQGDSDSWSGSCYTPTEGSSSARGIDQRDSDSSDQQPGVSDSWSGVGQASSGASGGSSSSDQQPGSNDSW
ncbi:hypothetical protein IWQ56_003208 [Coemansia nantahalensis]|nr:hypothetical protein IWQ56_003208 [Coemansia nantahalensis]